MVASSYSTPSVDRKEAFRKKVRTEPLYDFFFGGYFAFVLDADCFWAEADGAAAADLAAAPALFCSIDCIPSARSSMYLDPLRFNGTLRRGCLDEGTVAHAMNSRKNASAHSCRGPPSSWAGSSSNTTRSGIIIRP